MDRSATNQNMKTTICRGCGKTIRYDDPHAHVGFTPPKPVRGRDWERIAALVCAFLIGAVFGFLLSIPANAAEAGDVGCVTVEVNADDPYNITVTLVDRDDDVRFDVVGHYLWMQYAHNEPSSTQNNVSWDLHGYVTGDVLTACTDYIAQGVIATGPGAAHRVEVVDTVTQQTIAVVASSVAPHPDIIDAWIAANGFVVL